MRDVQSHEILGEIEAMYQDALEGIRGRDMVATENMAFYRGLHWGVAPESGGWVEPSASGEEAEVLNYIRPTVRSAVASMLRNVPSPEAVPTTSDLGSASRALATQRLVRSVLQDDEVFDVLLRGETDAQIKGACWYKILYDPNAPGGGKYRVEFRDILDALADPHATSEREIRHIFDRKMVPLSTLEDRFPVDAFGLETRGRFGAGKPEQARSDRDAIERAPQFMYGSWSRTGRAHGNTLCELVEYWERPTIRNPGGRLVVYSGDVVIVDSALPYEWPWVLRSGQNIVPNALYADGVVLDLKPINRTVNFAATKRKEHIANGIAAQLLVSKESKINVDHIDDITGGVIYWEGGNAALKPEWVQPAMMPQGLFETEQQGLSVMKDVSTYSDISRGDAPAGVETGRALAYLHEFQQGVREPDVRVFKLCIVRVLKKILSIIRDFYEEGRLVRIFGENGRWTIAPLRRAEFDFEADLVIEMDNGAPSSRALRLNEAIQVFQLGGFSDTPDAERFRKVVQYDHQDRSTIDAEEKHKMRCRGELSKIIENPLYPLAVRWGADDHQAYLDVLDDFLAGHEFDALPTVAQQSILTYLSEHEMGLAEQMGAFAQQQQALSPGGGGAPAEKQPGIASPFDGGTSDADAMSEDATFQQVSEPNAA